MMQHHRPDGAGGGVPSAPRCPALAAPAPANDNRRPNHQRRPAGATGLSLGEERDARRQPFIAVRLVGEDGRPGFLLASAADSREIIAIWRALGETLGLPLVLRDRWGRLHPVTIAPGQGSHARRRGSALAGRRPRFLARRRPALPVVRLA